MRYPAPLVAMVDQQPISFPPLLVDHQHSRKRRRVLGERRTAGLVRAIHLEPVAGMDIEALIRGRPEPARLALMERKAPGITVASPHPPRAPATVVEGKVAIPPRVAANRGLQARGLRIGDAAIDGIRSVGALITAADVERSRARCAGRAAMLIALRLGAEQRIGDWHVRAAETPGWRDGAVTLVDPGVAVLAPHEDCVVDAHDAEGSKT